MDAFLPPALRKHLVDGRRLLDSPPPVITPVVHGLMDRGDKLAIIGPSKTKKSFFVLQLGMCISSGKAFLNFEISKAQKTLVYQCEINNDRYHQRSFNMGKFLGISAESVGSNLRVVNARGLDSKAEMVERFVAVERPEVLIIDPIYRFIKGDENSATSMGEFLTSMDRLVEKYGLSLVYVHHDPKGQVGDRNIRDRGAGSGVLSRDYDACIALTEHRSQPDITVMNYLLRNYPDRSPHSCQWQEGGFVVSDVPPVVKNGRSPKPSIPLESLVPRVIDLLKNQGEMGIVELRTCLHKDGLSRDKERELIKYCFENKIIASVDTRAEPGKPSRFVTLVSASV